MSGILGGIVNAWGAANKGNVVADQERVKAALQVAQINRQAEQDKIAEAIRQREANSSLLSDRLKQAQITETDAQAKQRQYEVEHPKPVAPVMGTPEWQNAIDYEARTKAKYDYHAPPAPHNIDPLSPEGIRAKLALQQGKGGEGTPAQQLAGAQYSVAKDAAPDIDNYKPGMVAKGLSHVPVAGNWLLGHFNSDYQELDRDSRQFIEAYMHAQGGRRVTQQEYERLKGIYIPEPGDAPNTIARKTTARQAAMKSMHRMAGPVGDEVDAESGAGGKPSLHDRVQQLKAQGLTKDQARQQLQQEGYSF